MATKFSRRKVVSALVDMLESGATTKKIAETLAAYLIENRATRDMELYLYDIRAELEERFGLVAADVKSAKEITATLEKQIADFIKKTTNAKQVEVIKTVDKDLIGGVVISTTDAELDMSIQSKLPKLRSI